MGSKLQDQLEQCKTLPTLPAVATELVRLSNDDSASTEQFAETLSKDPALAAKILSVANSAMYANRAGAPTTVPQAVLRLGSNQVMAVALSLSLVRIPRRGDSFPFEAFWRRALLSGTAARCTATLIQCAPEEAFLAGMFQDIGMLALHEVLGAAYSELIGEADCDHLRLERLERERYATDHREVGTWLARSWKLPEYLIHTTRGSHNPAAITGSPAFGQHTRAAALGGFIADIWRPNTDQTAATRQAAECAKL